MTRITMENRYKTLKSDIIIFIVGTVLAKAIQFLLLPLYTTYMSTDAYGVAELTNNLSELFYPIVTLCIYEAAFRFAVDPDYDNNNLATAVTKILAVSIIIGLMVAIVAKYAFHYTYAFYLFFILYAYSIRMCAAYYVRGCGLSKVFAMSGVITAVTLSIFSILLLAYFNMGESGYLISIGLSYCCSAIYLFSRGKVYKSIQRNLNSKEDYTILLKYCAPLIFYNVLYWFITISGRYILLFFSDSSTAGKYVAAIKIAAVINMIQQAVYAAFQLNSSRVYTEDDRENYYTKTTNALVSLYCTFGSVIICLTPILARFTLKNDFYDAKIYLSVIMLASIVNCISSVLGTMYSTYKETKRMVGVSIVGAFINILVAIIFTPRLGIWGVCLASVLCYFSQTVYKFIDVKKFCVIKYDWKTIVPSLLFLTIQVVVMSFDVKYEILVSVFVAALILAINARYFTEIMKLFLRKNATV